MKRFLVFHFYAYYPAGGWDDLLGTADTYEEAVALAKTSNADNTQIVDTLTMKEVRDDS